MALNLTPRSYNIDPKGKDYVLDPAPLLRAQERNFHTQNETMKMVYETGRKGMEFAEYLGARQQLGRVKAQLTELDPNDPEFHRRLSSIIADNPLALENPNTAPGLKMALAPLTEEAGRAAKHRYQMEELTASYGSRAGLQAARAQGQMDVWQYKQNHAPPTEADKLFSGVVPPLPAEAVPPVEARAITDDPVTGATNVPVPGFGFGAFAIPGESRPVSTTPQNAGAPTAQPSADGNNIVFGPDSSLLPQGGDGAAPTPLPDITADPLPPGVRRGNDGALYKRKSVGKTSTWEPYDVAVAPPPKEQWPEGKYPVPVLNAGTNVPKSYKYETIPKEPGVSQGRINDYVKHMGDEDPQMIALSREVDGAKADFELAKTRQGQAEKSKDANAISIATNTTDGARQILLDAQRKQVERGVLLHNKALSVLDPKFVRAQQQYRLATRGADSVLETPPPVAAPPITAIPVAPVPAVAPDIRDELRKRLR